jgi:hypothetical protein
MALETAKAATKFDKIEITSDGTKKGTKILVNGSAIADLSGLHFHFYNDDCGSPVSFYYSTTDPNALPGSLVQYSSFELVPPVAVASAQVVVADKPAGAVDPGAAPSTEVGLGLIVSPTREVMTPAGEVWGPASIRQMANTPSDCLPRGKNLRDLMRLM